MLWKQVFTYFENSAFELSYFFISLHKEFGRPESQRFWWGLPTPTSLCIFLHSEWKLTYITKTQASRQHLYSCFTSLWITLQICYDTRPVISYFRPLLCYILFWTLCCVWKGHMKFLSSRINLFRTSWHRIRISFCSHKCSIFARFPSFLRLKSFLSYQLDNLDSTAPLEIICITVQQFQVSHSTLFARYFTSFSGTETKYLLKDDSD